MRYAEEIKVGVRYAMISFVMYLSYIVTSAKYLLLITASSPNVVMAVVGAVFAALTLILKFHFSTKVDS